jgi:dCTP diphosphatase
MVMELLKEKIREFAKERDWDKYHSPKNLAIGVSVEAAELLEIFLWLTEDESKTLTEKQLTSVKHEIGDIMIHLTNLADRLGLDPIECALEKIKLNQAKYPAGVVKGLAKKYTEYE